ncbi:MAG: heat shock protein DnaJ domain protein [Deltaproteobacteria bacterium]|nr:heat shock protein DnaJ domain protein [Deltaproteobacteria bacterium]
MGSGALSIKLRCASWQQLATIYKRDLSRGTMFLKAATPPEIGTQVRIDLTLPSASVIVLTGVVQHRVDDPNRGLGVELKLAPIPASSIWLIESALSSEQNRSATPPSGVPQSVPSAKSGPVAAVGDHEDMSVAETDLVRALVAEAESLKKLNPFLVLGVGYEATDVDVRAAFGDLTKRYHPDRFMRYESAELRQVAAEIFILIRDAYRRLGDDEGRTQVLTSLGRTPSPRAVPAPRAAVSTNPRNPSSVVTPNPRNPNSVVTPRNPNSVVTPNPRTTSSVVTPNPRNSSSVVTPSPRNPNSVVNPTPRNPNSVVTPNPRTSSSVVTPNPRASSEQRSSPGGAVNTPPRGVTQSTDPGAVEAMVDAGQLDEALAAYKMLAKRTPSDRTLRAGVELCEGLRALAQRDRLEAAQRFEAALEIDPSNERAARELADMRRQATHERKGLLTRLMGKREP